MTNTTYYFKSKAAAAVLAFFLGGLGIHRFYLGNALGGIGYLCLFVASFAFPPLVIAMFLIVLADMIYILCQNPLYFRRVLMVSEEAGV